MLDTSLRAPTPKTLVLSSESIHKSGRSIKGAYTRVLGMQAANAAAAAKGEPPFHSEEDFQAAAYNIECTAHRAAQED
jgi:hypothetical protein